MKWRNCFNSAVLLYMYMCVHLLAKDTQKNSKRPRDQDDRQEMEHLTVATKNCSDVSLKL